MRQIDLFDLIDDILGMIDFSGSFQSFDFIYRLQKDGLLFQKFIHLLVLVFS